MWIIRKFNKTLNTYKSELYFIASSRKLKGFGLYGCLNGGKTYKTEKQSNVDRNQHLKNINSYSKL